MNHWHYFDELLALALEKTRADYGDYQHYWADPFTLSSHTCVNAA